MTAKEGRKKSVRVLVAVGNGNGAAGKWMMVVGLDLALLKREYHVAGQIFPPDYIF